MNFFSQLFFRAKQKFNFRGAIFLNRIYLKIENKKQGFYLEK